MSGMEGLGRIFNVVPFAEAVWINMTDCQSITFVGTLAGAVGDTYTVAEATSAAGAGAQSLATVTQYYTAAGLGASAWVKNTQASAATVVTTATAAQNSVVFTIRAEELSDGFGYVRVTSSGAGLTTAILHELSVQRAPANLPAVSA